MMMKLTIDSLAAGGEGVGRDEAGRVTFVPRTAPGDRVVVRVVQAKKAMARGLVERIEAPGPARVRPACRHFDEGCGGCSWQHVALAAQRAAKQDTVARALRKLAGVAIHPIDGSTPALGWRRRVRFHVAGGRIGLYAEGSNALVPIARCPQLEPGLDAAIAAASARRPPDGELVAVLGARGDVVVGTEWAWPAGASVVGQGGVVGVVAGRDVYGAATVDVDDGIACGPWDFAQASAAGNRALRAAAVRALGAVDGAGRLLELHAGAGNLTRAYAAAGWAVTPSDAVAPPRAPAGFVRGTDVEVLARVAGDFDAVALDPPRTGCADAVPGILARAPRRIVYVSCDAATLARDAERLVAGGYRATDAYPLDLMPQTPHVEIALALVRA